MIILAHLRSIDSIGARQMLWAAAAVVPQAQKLSVTLSPELIRAVCQSILFVKRLFDWIVRSSGTYHWAHNSASDMKRKAENV